MTTQAKDRLVKRGAVAMKELLTAAVASTVISTLIAVIIPTRLMNRDASHVLFVVIVGALGLLMGFARPDARRFSAGSVFVFFLFEPIGRVLLRQEIQPICLFLTFPLALVAAYFFGREGCAGTGDSTVSNNPTEGDQ